MVRIVVFVTSLLAFSSAAINYASAVISGTSEPDYKYPWVVFIGGTKCKGVLIHPQSVLTAAHCVPSPVPGQYLPLYTRTDPHSSTLHKDLRISEQVIVHPLYTAN